jgi:subtilase family serine protease
MPGLEAYAKAVNDPHSAYYHQFLTPDEVGRRFGPAQADVDASVAFFRSHGIRVNEVAKNNFVVFAEGRADTVAKTFKTRLGYVRREDGTKFRTNLTELQMPASLVPKVVGVAGIDSSIRHVFRAHKFLKAAMKPGGDPTTTTITPALYRSAFGNTGYAKGFYGQGVNIAIANWDGYRLANIPYWTSANNLPVPSGGAGSNIAVVKVGTGTSTDGQGAAEGEGDLDLQAVLMAAPLANIYDYDDSTNDTEAPISTLSKISTDNIADIVSESYGWETSATNSAGTQTTYFGDFYVQAYNLHVSMAAQGITYMAASGDTGTRTFVAPGTKNGVCVAYPDIDPNVLIVGGSVPTIDETTGSLVNETNWGLEENGARWGGGTGGFDPYDSPANGFTFNVAPSYQTTNIASVTSTYNFRLVPDISNVAAGGNGLTAAAIYIYFGGTGSQEGLLGTSLASPATAGSLGEIMSQVFAGVTPNANRSNVRFGDLHSFLYANGSDPSLMQDITSGIGIGDLPQTSIDPTPDAGWDFDTGWGSPIYSGFMGYTTTGSSISTLQPNTALAVQT